MQRNRRLGNTRGDASHVMADTIKIDVAGPSEKKHVGCGAVARNRAQRYVRRHRIVRLLWPLFAAVIFVTLLLERRPVPPDLWNRRRLAGDDSNALTTTAPQERGTANKGKASIVSGDGDGALEGDPEIRHRPPSFFTQDIVHIVAFLVRNRGRIDTFPVRMKWDLVDRASLPLALYLRDIEARGTWNELEKEIQAVPAELCVRPKEGMPRSLRLRKLLTLLPEWAARGEVLLSSVESDGTEDDPTPGLVPDASEQPEGPSASLGKP